MRDGSPVQGNGSSRRHLDFGGSSSGDHARDRCSNGGSHIYHVIRHAPPVITVNGANPANINVGATYADLGAIITGPNADLNLGIHTFVDGIATDPVVIDTTTPGTHTIDYVVTDISGLTSTSTRTVIVSEPTNNNLPLSILSATGTDATSSTQ